MSRLPWVDYTRRNDPASIYWVRRLEDLLQKQEAPHVFCFWTKNPGYIAAHYKSYIDHMKSQGTIVLAQVTYNFYPELEPGVLKYAAGRAAGLQKLIQVLGGPAYVRLRIDPIIMGYTTPKIIEQSLNTAYHNNIKNVTTNILVPGYKGVGQKLLNQNIIKASDLKPDNNRINKAFTTIVKIAQDRDIKVSACAETSGLVGVIPGIDKAQCADPSWALGIKYNLPVVFKTKPSRKGCGCVYSADWGLYANQGAPACWGQCRYCYAQ